MAAGNATLYSAAVLGLGAGGFNLGVDTYFVALATTAYVPSPNTDAAYSDISPFEVAAGNGYTPGGRLLPGTTWTQSGAASIFAGFPVAWPGATFAARYAIVIRHLTSLPSANRLLCYVDLTGGGNVVATGPAFQINWNSASQPSGASPIFTLLHSP